MDARRIPRLALALMALAGPAFAQTDAPTRADEALDTRTAKAAAPAPFTPGKVERLLTTLETGRLFQGTFAGRDGFGIRIGGIENGAGLAVGPSWRASHLMNGNLHALGVRRGIDQRRSRARSQRDDAARHGRQAGARH